MEEILSRTLHLRHQRLIDMISSARDTLVAAETGVTKEALTAVQISLRHTLTQFTTELTKYIEKTSNPELELVSLYTADRFKAEDLLTEIDILFSTILSCNKDRQEQTNTNSQQDTEADVKRNSHHARLPKLELGKYDGNLLTWTNFWDQFEASVHKRNIPDVEKLSYLLSSLQGTAHEAVAGLGSTNLNYTIALDILKSRFGNPRIVVDAHNEALHKLPLSKPTAKECRQTLDAIEKHLRVLEVMGERVDGSHLRVIILSKFPENVLYQVNLATANDSSVDSIRKTLHTVVSALELSEITANSIPSTSTQSVSTEALHVKVDTKRDFSRNRKRKWSQIREDSRTGKGQGHSDGIKDHRTEYGGKRRKMKCAFCDNEKHQSENCDKYQTYKERIASLADKCYICFRNGHRASTCTMQWKCPHCGKRHNRALCFKKTQNGDKTLSKTNNDETEETSTMSNTSYDFLQTAVTQVKAGKSNIKRCRLLLDSGSQRSYMTTQLARKLSITPDKEDHLTVYTFGSNKPKNITSPSAEVTLITKRSIERKIRVNIVSNITKGVPVAQIGSLSKIDIKADDDTVGDSIDMLIGNDLYFSFIRTELIKLRDHVYLIDTDFGWIISGSAMKDEEEDVLSVVTYCQCHGTDCPYFTEPDLPLRSIDVKFLWTLESIGIVDSPKTTKEEDVVKYFNETTVYKEGRYEVKWPWIQFPPELPTNFGLAYGRLKNLLKRSDSNTIQEYNDILGEQLQANVIEEVKHEPTPNSHPVHYLPHHMVKQEGKRGRLVYDASAKSKDHKSLNECLYSGPCMLEDLTGLLLKFRMGKVGITADVEKAFLQVGLQEDDRDVTRFLWVRDPTKEVSEDNLIHYRFCRVPFGILSSPFLLTATIRFHMSRKNEMLLKEVADKCYVDNLVIAVDSTEKALQIHKQAKEAFDDISMNIRDWMSNDQDFLKTIPEDQKAKQRDQIKILGLVWNIPQDTLQLNVSKILTTQNKGEHVTKKDVLRTMARLYDPCGFVSPLILPAKLLFQELCIRKLKWESPLPKDLEETWRTIVKNLEMTKDVKVPRYVGNRSNEKELTFQLHCFTDASKNAYATVAYLRIIDKDNIETVLLMSKSRITPVEDKDDLKIPRLELLAYLIGARLLKYIKSHLEIKLSKLILWTDSEIVLAWMKSSKLLPPFVSRRVNEIKQTKDSLGMELRYINTKANPADIATRPEMWHQRKELWLHGPSFLAKKESHWPKDKQNKGEQILCLAGEALDILEGPEMTTKGYEDEETITEILDNQISSMEECESTEGSNKELVKSIENNESLMTQIKKLQQTYFAEEVLGKETSLSRNLGLFLDVDGVLRSRGRMSHANWNYDKRYPILLPKDSSFTDKIIHKIHEDNYHVGVSHTLSILREKYWIPQGRAQVQKTLKRCPQCEKHGGGPYRLPPAPALPAERVNYSTPYTFTGLDYLGPILVDSINGKEKRWICLFTCLAVRAVHLELVKDLTAEECLLAIRRFIASKGTPQLILSDNAQQFKLTSEVLNSALCKEKNIKWKFITQLAPWQGGFYERLVALVKNCMKRTLDKHLLTDNQLQTVTKEIEAVINTRPLTVVGSELEEVLRPADFLTLGECIDITPTFENSMVQGTNTKIDLIKGWKRGHMILEEYKKMFRNQYLPSLRERYNHEYRQPRVKSHKTPQIGDIVQIKDESNKNRTNWKVGKIVSLIKGRDGEHRVAKVKVGNSEFTRSIAQLYPLEAETHGGEVQQQTSPRSEGYPRDTSTPNPSYDDQQKRYEVPEPMEVDIQSPKRVTVEDASLPEDKTVEQTISSDLAMPDEVSILDSQSDLQLPPRDVETEGGPELSFDDTSKEAMKLGVKRNAAIRARQKIAEWTRQLLTLLL